MLFSGLDCSYLKSTFPNSEVGKLRLGLSRELAKAAPLEGDRGSSEVRASQDAYAVRSEVISKLHVYHLPLCARAVSSVLVPDL